MNQGTRLLALGATSAICHEVLKLYAAQGSVFFLAGRNAEKLSAIADDLVARGGTVAGSCSYDFNDVARHESCIEQAVSSLGAVDVALVAHGSLPLQEGSERSSAALNACLQDNFVSAAVAMQVCAEQLAAQGSGTLAVFSSVAGDRGRKSNYSYGAAKAGIDAFLQGLQGRFSGSDVSVVNIKPGMIKSPMTAEMKHGLIWSTPEKIAPSILAAISKGKRVCYVPGYWRLIMLVIRLLPTSILAKLPI